MKKKSEKRHKRQKKERRMQLWDRYLVTVVLIEPDTLHVGRYQSLCVGDRGGLGGWGWRGVGWGLRPVPTGQFSEDFLQNRWYSSTDSVIVGRLSLSNMFNILRPLESADGNRPTGIGRWESADYQSADG